MCIILLYIINYNKCISLSFYLSDLFILDKSFNEKTLISPIKYPTHSSYLMYLIFKWKTMRSLRN